VVDRGSARVRDGLRDEELEPGKLFDRRMASYLSQQRSAALSRRILLRGAAGAAGLAAVSLASGADAAGPRPFLPGVSLLKQEGNELVLGLEGTIRGVEPALAYDFTANPIVCQISEGLMRFVDGGAMEPWLAETYGHPDALTYVYTLRDGVLFHDGTTMTAEDVAASIERVRDPEVAGPMAWMYDPVDTVTVDGRTVTITLKSPSALFQFVAATTAGHVVPKAAIEEFGLDFQVNPVGTGPFKAVSVDLQSEVVIERNPDYWVEGLPYLDRVTFKVIQEGTTRTTALKTGEIGAVIGSLAPEQIETIQGFDNVTFQDVVGYTITHISFRCDKPPFDDVNVRKAVAHAIDMDAIITNLVKDTGVRARNTAVPPDMPGSAADVLEPIPYDLEMAKQLLAQSSQPNGFSTEIHVIAPNDIWVPTVVAIQEALQELNIEAEVKQYPYADFITLSQGGEWEGMLHGTWGSDFPDATGNLLPLFHSRNVPPQNNNARYSNARVDELLDAAEAEQDPEAREQMLIEAQQIVSDEQPEIFIDHFKWFMPLNNALTGYAPRPLWYWDAFCRELKPV
jgi:peptide/nickel transport system substrate-binding protein